MLNKAWFLPAGLFLGTALGWSIVHWSQTPEPEPQRLAPRVKAESVSSSKLPSQSPEIVMPTSEERPLSVSDFLRRLSELSEPDPWAKIKKLIAQVPPEQLTSLLGELSSQKDTRNRTLALLCLFPRLAEKDPRALLEWIAKNPADALPNLAIEHLIKVTFGRSPAQALALVGAFQPEQAKVAVVWIYRLWSQSDPAAAAAQLPALPTRDLQNEAAGVLALAWGAKDPQAALAWASQLPLHEVRQSFCRDLFMAWIQENPQQVFDYVEKMPDIPERKNAIDALIEHPAGMKEPARVMQLLERMLPGTDQDNLLNGFALEWLNADPQQALAWAKAQTDKHVQEVVWPTAISRLATTDPVAAAQWALSMPESDSIAKAEVLGNVASIWADKDPAAADAFVQRLPDAESRQEATQHLAQSWMRNDPAAAAHWLNTLTADERRDAALRGFVLVSDPPNAGQWALSIQNQQSRTELLTYVARKWMESDPEAATRWMAQPAFPAELRERLQKP